MRVLATADGFGRSIAKVSLTWAQANSAAGSQRDNNKSNKSLSAKSISISNPSAWCRVSCDPNR